MMAAVLCCHHGAAVQIQSWGVSRFNGQLSMLAASVERAGATLACLDPASGAFDAAAIRVRHEVLVDRWYFAQMRVILCATAASALAVLILMLL